MFIISSWVGRYSNVNDKGKNLDVNVVQNK
jgi:hypothetical protein